MIRITRKVFDRIVEDAIASLPEEFAQWIEEVPIIVEDRPGKADAQAVLDPEEDEGGDPLGLHCGPSVGMTRHSGDMPPRIMIYRQPLMEACKSREQLEEEIRKTLLHELGHHAGMDEDQLDALGYGPMEDEDDIEWDVEEGEER